MEISRRKWMKATGLVLLGLGVTKLESFASPLTNVVPLPPGAADSPVRISSNENPYGPSPMARTAMAESIHLSNRYQWKMCKDLISAIAAKNNVSDNNVLIGAGSTQMIDTTIQFAALRKGNFIIAEPTFSRWTSTAENCGLQKISVPLTPDKRHDLDAMLKRVNADTRMIYVCNPNNPTGTICKYDSLASFVKEATKKTMVLADEAYLDYTDEPSLSRLVTENENLIVIKTFSKIYGLAGGRIGYALAHSGTIEQLGRLQSGSNVGISAVSLAAAIASLKDVEFVKESYLQNERTRSFTTAQLTQMNIPCIPSHSNFIYFSLKNYKKDFFEQLKINNIEGTHIFEENGKWSRITVGTMQEMKKFIHAIE